MSFWARYPVAALEDSRLTANDRLVLLAISSFADADGTAWPGISSLIRRSALSRSAVIRSLDHLESAGVITRTKRRDDGKKVNLPNVYKIVEGSVSQTLGSVSQELGWCLTDTRVVSHRHPNLAIELSQEQSLREPCDTQPAKSAEEASQPPEGNVNKTEPDEASRPASKAGDGQPDLYGEVVQRWNAVMPEHGGLPAHAPSKAHRENFFARVRASPEREKIDWWRALFNYVLLSAFLTGRVEPKPGKRPFKVSLEWIVGDESRLTKILGGQYHDAPPERFVEVKEPGAEAEKEVPKGA
jgi:hypothetical protein